MIAFTYLVTRDVTETLERKVGYDFSNGTKTKIKSTEADFLLGFWDFIPERIQRVEMDASSVTERLESAIEREEKPVVSLDRVYIPNAQAYFEVTRITNPESGEIEIGPRPDCPSLEEQLDKISYDEVVLADVGAFEGDTMSRVSELFKSREVSVDEVLLGFSDKRARNRLGRIVKSLFEFNFYEWIELRDFFGIDGRRLEGGNGFMPYWENPSEWASIPEEQQQDFAKYCKEYNDKLLDILCTAGYDLERIGEPVTFDEGPK